MKKIEFSKKAVLFFTTVDGNAEFWKKSKSSAKLFLLSVAYSIQVINDYGFQISFSMRCQNDCIYPLSLLDISLRTCFWNETDRNKLDNLCFKAQVKENIFITSYEISSLLYSIPDSSNFFCHILSPSEQDEMGNSEVTYTIW